MEINFSKIKFDKDRIKEPSDFDYINSLNMETIGFVFSIQCKIKSFTSGNTLPSGPLKAQSLRFLAAPKPPGITNEDIAETTKPQSKRLTWVAIGSRLVGGVSIFDVSLIPTKDC